MHFIKITILEYFRFSKPLFPVRGQKWSYLKHNNVQNGHEWLLQKFTISFQNGQKLRPGLIFPILKRQIFLLFIPNAPRMDKIPSDAIKKRQIPISIFCWKTYQTNDTMWSSVVQQFVHTAVSQADNPNVIERKIEHMTSLGSWASRTIWSIVIISIKL